jgi:hypothetical protein
VAFQIVQTSKSGLAGRTFVRLFLTVGQKMAFEIVVPREIGGAVGALVTLGGRRLWRVLAISWQTHLPSWRARIWLGRKWAGKREGAVAGVVTRIWRDELVLVLLVLYVLRRAVLALWTRGCLEGARGWCACHVIAIA